jgi:hypothetical protein
MAAAGGVNLTAELHTLETFRNRVDDLLATLSSSPASTKSISSQTFDMSKLGQTTFPRGLMGFDEVINLSSTYSVVQEQLQTLSKTLSDQINAMSITIYGAAVGYDNVEASQVDTLLAIQGQTTAAAPPPGQSGLTVQQQIDQANREADLPPKHRATTSTTGGGQSGASPNKGF